MLGERSRFVLNPAAKVISGTARQILDCLNALLAERYEHQRCEPRNAFKFVCDAKFLSLSSSKLASICSAKRAFGWGGVARLSTLSDNLLLVLDVVPKERPRDIPRANCLLHYPLSLARRGNFG